MTASWPQEALLNVNAESAVLDGRLVSAIIRGLLATSGKEIVPTVSTRNVTCLCEGFNLNFSENCSQEQKSESVWQANELEDAS